VTFAMLFIVVSSLFSRNNLRGETYSRSVEKEEASVAEEVVGLQASNRGSVRLPGEGDFDDLSAFEVGRGRVGGAACLNGLSGSRAENDGDGGRKGIWIAGMVKMYVTNDDLRAQLIRRADKHTSK
jgi:hypothetical protein